MTYIAASVKSTSCPHTPLLEGGERLDFELAQRGQKVLSQLREAWPDLHDQGTF